MSSSYYNYYQTGALGDLEMNTAPTVSIAATTALGLTCRLTTTDCPVELMSSECILCGSLPAGSVGGGPSSYGLLSGGLYQPMQYWIRIAPDAKPGHYQLPLIMTYKRLADDYQYTSVFGPVMRLQQLCRGSQGRLPGHRDHGAVRPGALEYRLYQHGTGHGRHRMH